MTENDNPSSPASSPDGEITGTDDDLIPRGTVDAIKKHLEATQQAAEQASAGQLSREVECEAWKAVIKYAYADGGDGARNIYNITSEYINMRKQLADMGTLLTENRNLRDDLKKELAETRGIAGELADLLNQFAGLAKLIQQTGSVPRWDGPEGSSIQINGVPVLIALAETTLAKWKAAGISDSPTPQPPEAA